MQYICLLDISLLAYVFLYRFRFEKAHRATLALEHHHGRVEYEWVEALVRSGYCYWNM